MENKAEQRQALGYFEAYKRSNNYDLYDVYDSWSSAKTTAWKHCRDICVNLNGRALKIISANAWRFTAGFTYVDVETGKEKFVYITKDKHIEVEVPEEVA